jgi:hypothetical protein
MLIVMLVMLFGMLFIDILGIGYAFINRKFGWGIIAIIIGSGIMWYIVNTIKALIHFGV